MPHRIIDTESKVYTVAMDDEIPISMRNWVIVQGRVTDELLLKRNVPPAPPVPPEPLETLIEIEVQKPDCMPKVAEGGLVGLVGIPRKVFPQLDRQPYPIQFTIKAAGYLPLIYTTKIGPMPAIGPRPGFPSRFTPLVIPDNDLSLHREPVVITGRIMKVPTPVTGVPVPIVPLPAGRVTVNITKTWRLLEDINNASAAKPINLVSLQPPLYFNREAAVTQLRRQDMVPVVNEDKYVLNHVSKGSNSLSLSNRINIVSGNIIVIDEADPELTEYLTIGIVSGSANPTEPAVITITPPLANAHRMNAVVRKVNRRARGANNQVSTNAIAGDVCIFLNSMTGLVTDRVVRIYGGTNPSEYHLMRHFSVESDADGYFRFPPISRVAQVTIEFRDGATTVKKDLTLDYSQRENRFDIVLR